LTQADTGSIGKVCKQPGTGCGHLAVAVRAFEQHDGTLMAIYDRKGIMQ